MMILKTIVSMNMASVAVAFGIGGHMHKRPTFAVRSSTSLNLNPRIAQMIDGEYWRENHLKELEQERFEHNEAVLEHDLPAQFDAADDDFFEPTFHIQEKKDRKMAREHPQQYCADRCLATGYCDAFEDIFDFSPAEVIGFCTDCVLSEDEEPCDIPYDAMDEFLKNEKPSDGQLRP